MTAPRAFTQQEYQFIKATTKYDPETGEFERLDLRLKDPVWRKVDPTLHRTGYCQICYCVDGKAVLFWAHRIAYLLMTEELDFKGIDHIDGDKANNRWENLRLATPAQNQGNRRGLGVHWRNDVKKWHCQIRDSKKVKYLGLYADKEEALAVYRKAHANLHKEFSPWFNDYGQSDEIEEALAV